MARQHASSRGGNTYTGSNSGPRLTKSLTRVEVLPILVSLAAADVTAAVYASLRHRIPSGGTKLGRTTKPRLCSPEATSFGSALSAAKLANQSDISIEPTTVERQA